MKSYQFQNMLQCWQRSHARITYLNVLEVCSCNMENCVRLSVQYKLLRNFPLFFSVELRALTSRRRSGVVLLLFGTKMKITGFSGCVVCHDIIDNLTFFYYVWWTFQIQKAYIIWNIMQYIATVSRVSVLPRWVDMKCCFHSPTRSEK